MTYDDRAKALAARMLAPTSRGGKGLEVTLHQPGSGGTFDPATDTTSGATPPQDHVTSGVEDKNSTFSIGTGVVAAGDVKLLLSPVKLDGSDTPEPIADSWTLTMAGKPWTIKQVGRTQPAGMPVLFELQLRA